MSPGSHNMTDASEQLCRRNGFVGREQRVAPSDRVRHTVNGCFAKHAVSDQFSLASEEDDIARSDLPHIASLNEENVTRPYGGKHAQARNFQSPHAERPQHLPAHHTLPSLLPIPPTHE